jgi:uncharacterized protein YkwD
MRHPNWAVYYFLNHSKSTGLRRMPDGTPLIASELRAPPKGQPRLRDTSRYIPYGEIHILAIDHPAFGPAGTVLLDTLPDSPHLETPTRSIDPTRAKFPTHPQGLPTGTENIPSDNEAYEQEVLTLVNAERQKRNLAPLAWNENLARAARYHAADMATNGYFDHDSMARPAGSPNARPRRIGSWQDRVTAFDPTASGENIAHGQPTPAAVMKSWMNSSGHRANILRPTNATLGIGFVDTHWVQNFGR